MAGWLGFQLYRVALARGLRERRFTDLRDADWTLVRYLHHSGGASVTEIAHYYDVTKQAASQHVSSFVSRGYGKRTRPGDDGRVRLVELTDKGRAAIEIADGIEAELVRRLGRDALDSWRRVTDALIELHLQDAPTWCGQLPRCRPPSTDQGDTVPDPSITDRLRQVTHHGVPGIAVAIAGPEGLRETAAAGYADLAAREPASADMVCPWFSMTKIVTATLAMRMVGQGLLNLYQPVLPLVPELAVMRPQALAERITPRHLLTHSAGFANPLPVRWIHPAGQPGPDQAALLTRLLARHRKLRFEPGTRSAYSNLSTLTLGQAITNAAGAPYTGLVSSEILQPLGMHMTGFGYSPDMLARAASGYHPGAAPCDCCCHAGSSAPGPAAGCPSAGSCWTAPPTAACSGRSGTRPASCRCTCATENLTGPVSCPRHPPPKCGTSS
jgi:CubicO group peptidase (beta-lactamase class C family)/DNA-binding MarR family transcriptional regulator